MDIVHFINKTYEYPWPRPELIYKKKYFLRWWRATIVVIILLYGAPILIPGAAAAASAAPISLRAIIIVPWGASALHSSTITVIRPILGCNHPIIPRRCALLWTAFRRSTILPWLGGRRTPWSIWSNRASISSDRRSWSAGKNKSTQCSAYK